MIQIFKTNKTRWIPLGSYTWGDGDQHIIFVRGNKKTGMLYFKSKQVNARGYSSCVRPIIPNSLIDPKIQFDKIIEMVNT